MTTTHSPQYQNNPTPKSATSQTTTQPMAVTAIDLTSKSFDAEQILYLQRTIGNHATRQLLQRTAKSVMIQRGINIDDEEDSVNYSESKEDERDIPMVYEDEQEDLSALRDELQSLGKDDFVAKHGFSPYITVLEHIADELMVSGEEAITGDEIDLIIDRLTRFGNLGSYGNRTMFYDKSPTIKLHFETAATEAELADHKSDEARMMDTLRTLDLSDMRLDLKPLLRAKRYYDNPPEDFDQVDELRSLLESDTWSFLLVDGVETEGDLKKLIDARHALKRSERADATGADPMAQLGEGVVDSAGVASQGLTISRGVSLLSDINKETNGKDMVTAGMETLFDKIISYSFAPVSIGSDLIRAFHYNKRRRDGYEAAMERASIDKDGKTSLKDDTPENIEKIRLGRVALYAFKKTRRAFWGSIVKATLKLVRWISHIITLLSGGTTAIVTGAIAVASDVTRALMGIGKRLKGLYKSLTGKRGAERKRNAKELMALAVGGSDDAIQTIWDVNPFDETTATTTKKAWNNMKGPGWFYKSMELPKPDSVVEFKESLKTGYYSSADAQTVLTGALQNTMKSS